jgi:DNA invertase Pin-like site-specific DNA recombinase
VRIGYARVNGRFQDHQMQLDALAGAGCQEMIVETASTRSEQPRATTVLVAARATSAVVLTYDPDRYTCHRVDVVDLRP